MPENFGFTQPNASDDAIDSDADPRTGDTPLVFYTPGQASLDISAGVSEVTGGVDLESTVLAPTAAIERVIDFDADALGNALAAGNNPATAYAAFGLTISSADADHPAMIFDSANPTGGDEDLRTAGWHPSNQTARGNILIISEDGDATDPDDNRRGGTLLFNFDEPVQLRSLSLLDNQSRRTAIKVFGADGALLRSIAVPKGRNNAIQQIDVNTDAAAYMTVTLGGSGAITELTYNQAQYGDVDADTPVGPTLVTGGNAQLTYTATNTGNSALTGFAVTDERGAADPVNDPDGFNAGDIDQDGVFDPGEAWVFTRTTPVLDESNLYNAVATGTPINPYGFTGLTVSDADATYFVGGLSETPVNDGVEELEPVYVLAGFTPDAATQNTAAGLVASVDTWYDAALSELGLRVAVAEQAGLTAEVITFAFADGTSKITVDTANAVVTVTDAAGTPITSSLTDDELVTELTVEDTDQGRVIGLVLHTESVGSTGFDTSVDLSIETFAGSTATYDAATGALTALTSVASGGFSVTGVRTQSTSGADTGAIQQQAGQAVLIDAADVDTFNNRFAYTGWRLTDQAGDTGEGSITTGNWWRRVDRRFTQRSPQASYTVNFAEAGTYYVWIRGSAPDTVSNSVHVGLNGQAVNTADRITLDNADGAFHWTNQTMDHAPGSQASRATITVTEAGVATIDLWMREDGFTIDSIYLTQDACETPSGQGPVANLRVTPDTGLNLRLVNVGDPLLDGSISVDENGVITLTGAGSNIGGANDAFTFAGTQVQGDFEIVAEFLDFDQAEYWSRAGLMARESLDADAAFAFAAINGGNQTAFEFREDTGGPSTYDWTARTSGSVWMKLVREDDVFTTYHSNDGTTWSAVASQTLGLTEELWLGLAIVSHDEDETATAQFANVTINGQPLA